METVPILALAHFRFYDSWGGDTRMATIRCNVAPDTDITLEVDGNGPAVFLLHGIGGNRGQWFAQQQTLARQHAVFAWDARGYGDSLGPRVLSMRDFAQDFVRLLDRLELDRVIAVGHSMGGRILLEICDLAPDRLAAMALSGTQASYLTHMNAADRQNYVSARKSLFDDAGNVTEEKARIVARQVLPDHVLRQVQDSFVRDLQQLNKAGYLAAIAASVGWDRNDLLEKLGMPVCVFGGALDTVCPPDECRRIAGLIGQGPATILDNVGHMGQLEAPQATTEILAGFIAQHAHLADTIDTGIFKHGAITSETS